MATTLQTASGAEAPVFKIVTAESKITFFVKASVGIEGTFDKSCATLRFGSPDVETGVLDVRIQAASMNTGSGMKDGKLKGEDFFDVKNNPEIRFVSKKFIPVGPNEVRIEGEFRIRGVSKT